jgi:integrase
VSLAVEFAILTGSRIAEVTKARWQEFDMQTMVWTTPWGHLKTGHIHETDLRRPISKPMLAVLEEMQARRTNQSPDAVVFQAQWSRSGELNRGNVSTFIEDQLGWTESKITNHGFRSTLKDFCVANHISLDLWKFQVDHAVGTKSDRSYGGNDPEPRRGMMKLYGDYLSKPTAPKAATVTNIADKRRRA